MPRTLRLGSSFAFNGGDLVKGRPPAKCTKGVNDGLFPAQNKLIGRWTLPNDTALANVLGFSVAVSLGDPVDFPVGASPDLSLGKVDKWQIEGYPIGQLVDAWVVTSDKYSNPTSPTGSNALYLGRAKISTSKNTKVLAQDAALS